VVASKKGGEVARYLKGRPKINIVYQKKPLGTAHSVQSCAAALKKFKDIGVQHMALQFMVGRWPERKLKIDRFAKEVMPALRG